MNKKDYNLALMDLLLTIGRYDAWVCFIDNVDNKRSGIIKLGNLTFKQLAHYMYKRKIMFIDAGQRGDKKVLFISLFMDK